MRVTVWSAVSARFVGAAICAATYTAPLPIGSFQIELLVNGCV